LRKIFYYIFKLFGFFIKDSYYANFLFLINCLRLKRPYYWLNLEKPKTFNEIIWSLKLKDVELKGLLSNKATLKKEVFSLFHLEVNTPEIIHIFESCNDLRNFDFKNINDLNLVLKANHGSGMNIFLQQGIFPSSSDLARMCSWFAFDSTVLSRERHYGLIEKKVIVEKSIGDNINDYKFHCFSGEPVYIQVDIDRFTGHHRNFYNTNWDLQNWELNYKKSLNSISKPSNFSEMLQISKLFCSHYILNKYVRVDFYEHNGIVYLGELTFHPGGGVEPFDSKATDLMFGSLINL